MEDMESALSAAARVYRTSRVGSGPIQAALTHPGLAAAVATVAVTSVSAVIKAAAGSLPTRIAACPGASATQIAGGAGAASALHARLWIPAGVESASPWRLDPSE